MYRCLILLLLVVLLASGCAGGGAEVTSDAGFAFVPPAGWKVDFETVSVHGGVVVLAPEEPAAHSPEASFVLMLGSPSLMITSTQALTAGVGVDTMLNTVLSTMMGDDNVFTVGAHEPIQVGGSDGVAGLAVDWSAPTTQGRYALARVDEGRWFSLNGTARSGEWNPAPFDTILDTVRFFEPVTSP
jgi:hypothetical protein